jgi:hypothetical protein
VETANVVTAQVSVSNAFVKVDADDENVLPISETASTTKIQLIKTEKISSVNRVRYFTKLEADVKEDTSKMRDVQSPVHA